MYTSIEHKVIEIALNGYFEISQVKQGGFHIKMPKS